MNAQQYQPAVSPGQPDPLYAGLAGVLSQALAQASRGKGVARHARNGEPFEKQVICEGARRFGTGALLFQAHKKADESQRLPVDAAVNELLGAIVYLAAAVIVLREEGAEPAVGVNQGVLGGIRFRPEGEAPARGDWR